jgi:hypothetical protein
MKEYKKLWFCIPAFLRQRDNKCVGLNVRGENAEENAKCEAGKTIYWHAIFKTPRQM